MQDYFEVTPFEQFKFKIYKHYAKSTTCIKLLINKMYNNNRAIWYFKSHNKLRISIKFYMEEDN